MQAGNKIMESLASVDCAKSSLQLKGFCKFVRVFTKLFACFILTYFWRKLASWLCIFSFILMMISYLYKSLDSN